MASKIATKWQSDQVTSPQLKEPVSVVVARDIPYVAGGHRFQTLTIYLPQTSETAGLVGTTVTSLPAPTSSPSKSPSWCVHIHGGAWRAAAQTSSTIEPAVACAFSAPTPSITAVASINYSLSQTPTHPTDPYDAIKDNHSDPAREAVHPQHIHDALRGFALLRDLGLSDGSYILSGHSCGACMAFQSCLQTPAYWGLTDVSRIPQPAAVLGLNGLYDLPDLVHRLGASHEKMSTEYVRLLSEAFGKDESAWPAASPARFDVKDIEERLKRGDDAVPPLVVLEQSLRDELVPFNQLEKLEARLLNVKGLEVRRGKRCTGSHMAPWQQGDMIWQCWQDVQQMLSPAGRL